MDNSSINNLKLLEPFVLPSRIERFRNVAAARTDALTVVLDRLHHEHNISAVVRSADAFGLRSIHVVGPPAQIHSTISIGSERWVDIHTHDSVEKVVMALRAAEYKLVVLQAADKSGREVTCPVYRLPFNEKLALVFGNEKDGLAEQFITEADIIAHIPMLGFAESLNVSVAVAISIFCSTLSGAQPLRQTLPISPDAQEILVGQWLHQDVRAAELIIKRAQDKRSTI
jgi:tRNA (guanosine-2'-O-)-methyltransferase